jgi:hypothetical protein
VTFDSFFEDSDFWSKQGRTWKYMVGLSLLDYSLKVPVKWILSKAAAEGTDVAFRKQQ